MSPVPLIHREGDRIIELLVDPTAWIPKGASPDTGLSLRAAVWLRRSLSTAETADCTCPADCVRDHTNE